MTSAIDDGMYNTIPLQHNKQAAMAFEDFYKGIETLVRPDTRIITVPGSCPDEYNSEVIARKCMLTEVNRELSATLTPKSNAGRQAADVTVPAPNQQRLEQGAPPTPTQPER